MAHPELHLLSGSYFEGVQRLRLSFDGVDGAAQMGAWLTGLRAIRDAFAPEDAKDKLRTFIDSLCPHEVAMLAGSMASRDCLLLSMPDARSLGGNARVLLLCTHGIDNECQPGCFCGGRGFDSIDIQLVSSIKIS